MSPIKRMTSAFSSAGDRSSRFPGGDMPFQNLKSLYVERPDLSIFTRAVAPCLPYSCRQQNLRCPDFCPYYVVSSCRFVVGICAMHESDFYTHDAPAIRPKRRTSTRDGIYRRMSYPLLGEQATGTRGV